MVLFGDFYAANCDGIFHCPPQSHSRNARKAQLCSISPCLVGYHGAKTPHCGLFACSPTTSSGSRFAQFSFLQPKQKGHRLVSFALVAGVGFEPHDLRVMSPTSYQAALPRDIKLCDPETHGWCRRPGSNRYDTHVSRDFKSRASACSATPAKLPVESIRCTRLNEFSSVRLDIIP